MDRACHNRGMAVADVVDTDRYPLADPDGDAWRAVVARTRRELAEVGCSVLTGFIRPDLFEALRGEGERAAPRRVLPGRDRERLQHRSGPGAARRPPRPRHDGAGQRVRGARPDRAESAIIHRLYTSPQFQRFVADCFELDQLYELADPLSGLVLNVIRPGREHPWHFDTNEFTVSLLTQEPAAGGVFEYCPNIRSARDERFDDVRAVLDGRGERLIRQLVLRPGDLQLFKGRYALHRVSTVHGDAGPAHGHLRLQRAPGRHRQPGAHAPALRPGAARAPGRGGTGPGRPAPGLVDVGPDGGACPCSFMTTARPSSTTSTRQPDPRTYFRTLRKLDYQIPQLAKPRFARLVDELRSTRRTVTVLDIGCSYGINAALLRYDLTMDELYERYGGADADWTRAELLDRDRCSRARTGAGRAVRRARRVPARPRVRAGGRVRRRRRCTPTWSRPSPTRTSAPPLAASDLVISTGCVGYVTERTLARVVAGRRPSTVDGPFRAADVPVRADRRSAWPTSGTPPSGSSRCSASAGSPRRRSRPRCWTRWPAWASTRPVWRPTDGSMHSCSSPGRGSRRVRARER